MIAPVVLLVLLGSIEFGRAMFLQQVAIHTARAACRQGVLSSASNSAVQSSSSTMLQNVGVAGGSVTIRVNGQSNEDVSNAAPGDSIEISVLVPYAQNSWLPSSFYLTDKSLSGRVTMSKE